MKLFKKAKELLGRIAGNHDTPPGPRPEPTPKADILPAFFDTRPQYRRDQAEFKDRAKATTVFHSGGTLKLGNNAAERRNAADIRKLHGLKGGWKKIVRLQGIAMGRA